MPYFGTLADFVIVVRIDYGGPSLVNNDGDVIRAPSFAAHRQSRDAFPSRDDFPAIEAYR